MNPGDDRESAVKPRIQTMTALSKQIEVSRPTLARYFENPDSVLPSTARKIRDRLAEVDYVYNFMATRQNRKSTGLIGVVIPQYRDLFFASLLDSIEQAATDAGFTVFTQSSMGNAETEAAVVEKLRSMNVDGAIVAPLGDAASTQALSLAGRDFPVVFVDSEPASPISGTDFVGTDNDGSIRSIVDLLCRTGDAPVFLGMPRLNNNALAREAAYRAAMRDRGLEGHLVETMDIPGSWGSRPMAMPSWTRISAGAATPMRRSCARTTAWRSGRSGRRTSTACSARRRRSAGRCGLPGMTTIRSASTSPLP